MRRLQAGVGRVASHKIAALYVSDNQVDAKTQQDASARATKIVQSLTGKLRSKMSIDEVQAVRVAKPELYKEYLAVRKEITEATKAAIIAITRSHGAPMPVADLIKRLERDGIEHSLPKSFHGLVDEKGYYTVFGEPVNATPMGSVKMNPAYKAGDLQWVFQYQTDGAKTWQTAYTKAAKAIRTDIKFKKVADTMADISNLQKIWRGDLMGRDVNRQELGCITEILYLTASRIGTPGNETDGQATFGLTTIVGGDVTFQGANARIRYRAKKGASFDFVIYGDDKYGRQVVKLLKAFVAEAGKTGRVFDSSSKDVNAYLKGRVKMPITSHGFRYMRGTGMMVELLDAAEKRLGKNPSERDVNREFNRAAEQVGELLGHTNKKADGTTNVTGTTAVKSYIDPSVSRAFFETFKMRPPSTLEKMR